MLEIVELKILDVDLYSDGVQYATDGSCGLDLRTSVDVALHSQCTMLVGSGLAVSISDHSIAAFIYPRSGLGHKDGLILGNSTGVIDSDYQGEIKISLYNRSNTTLFYRRGTRVAQLVFQPIIRPELKIVVEFAASTLRGDSGFGSTGAE